MTENKAIKEFSDYVRIIDKRRQMRRRNETEPWNKDDANHVDDDEKKPKLLHLLTKGPRSEIITVYLFNNRTWGCDAWPWVCGF